MLVTLQAYLAQLIRDHGYNGIVNTVLTAQQKGAYEIEVRFGEPGSIRKFIVDGDMVFDVTEEGAE